MQYLWLAFIVLIIAGIILWIFPILQTRPLTNLTPKELCELRDKYRKTIAQILGGFALLAGLFFTSQNLYLAKEGQVTDRFIRAVQQLGSEKIEVRIGGIYGLERIAKDSERDHIPIMEILTAFIRSQAPLKKTGELNTQKLAEDVQAALNVLGRREWRRELKKDRITRFIDLRNTNLAGANLAGAHFEFVNLQGSNLRSAMLTGAYLQYAILDYANLEHAYLLQTHLENATLQHAKLDGASFNNTYLTGAIFYDTDLSNVQTFTEQQYNSILKNEKTIKPNHFYKR